jgi:hypothetical protein
LTKHKRPYSHKVLPGAYRSANYEFDYEILLALKKENGLNISRFRQIVDISSKKANERLAFLKENEVVKVENEWTYKQGDNFEKYIEICEVRLGLKPYPTL